MNKWLKDRKPDILFPKGLKIPLWKKGILRMGLETVDRIGTPVIVRTPWTITQKIPQIKATQIPSPNLVPPKG